MAKLQVSAFIPGTIDQVYTFVTAYDFEGVFDHTKDRISLWGHWTVVSSKEDADFILNLDSDSRICAGEYDYNLYSLIPNSGMTESKNLL